jgi:signal recognition particle subunit SRP72
MLTCDYSISDAATKAVAQNNAMVLEPQDNPYVAQKIIQAVPKIAGNDRLFYYQSSVLRRNKYAIELQAQKFGGVKKTTANIISGDGSAVSTEKATLGVLHAAAAAQLQTGKDALKSILPLLEKRPEDLGLLLTVIQLHLQLQNPAQALNLLEAFFKRLETAATSDQADVRFAPGLVALAVSLYKLQGRHTAVRAELAKAAAHWEKSTANRDTASQADSLLREAGIALLHSSNPSDLSIAGGAFKRLTSSSPSDRLCQAGLIATTSSTKSTSTTTSLTPISTLISGVDVSSLLSSGVATLASPPQSSKKRPATDEATKVTKRRRPNKLPKDFDPNKKPDPERWLPLRDRSSYKPKKGKGKKRAADLTQGGVVKEEEMLELAGGAGSVKVEKAGGGGGNAGGNKKKKGKGKK